MILSLEYLIIFICFRVTTFYDPNDSRNCLHTDGYLNDRSAIVQPIPPPASPPNAMCLEKKYAYPFPSPTLLPTHPHTPKYW